MKKFWLTYYPIMVSALYMFFYGAYGALYIMMSASDDSVSPGLALAFIIPLIVVAIIGFIESVYFMTKALKQNDTNWAILVFLLGPYVIPYYNVKHVLKDDNAKTKNVIFIIDMVIACLLGFFASLFLLINIT